MRRPLLRSRRGFTVVELVIAIIILAIGVVGLMATSLVVLRQMRTGQRQAVAATLAQSTFDSLASRPCAALVSGSANGAMGIREWWTVSGNGAARIASDSIVIPVHRGERAYVFSSTILCR